MRLTVSTREGFCSLDFWTRVNPLLILAWKLLKSFLTYYHWFCFSYAVDSIHASISITMPAAMVSPPRRNNTLPISLLAAKDSIGMARAAAVGPDIVLVLRVICTSADVLFVSTRGFNFRVFPEARSIVEINFNTVAGTSREWWKSSIDVPAVIGSWMSNMMIRAVNVVTRGTKSVVEHRTFPMVRWIGSTAVRDSVALEPAATHSTFSSSTSIDLTVAVSSPGRILSLSPTWTTPLQSLPETAVPEPWLLNTFDIGILKGPRMSRAGGSNRSSRSTRVGPLYHFLRWLASSPWEVTRLMPCIAPTGTYFVFAGWYPDCRRNGRRSEHISS